VGQSSPDQTPADLSAAFLSGAVASAAAADDACGAAGNRAFDPSSSPD
jgi:hypothetical protein